MVTPKQKIIIFLPLKNHFPGRLQDSRFTERDSQIVSIQGWHNLHGQPQILMLVAWERPMMSLSLLQPVLALHQPFPSRPRTILAFPHS